MFTTTYCKNFELLANDKYNVKFPHLPELRNKFITAIIIHVNNNAATPLNNKIIQSDDMEKYFLNIRKKNSLKYYKIPLIYFMNNGVGGVGSVTYYRLIYEINDFINIESTEIISNDPVSDASFNRYFNIYVFYEDSKSLLKKSQLPNFIKDKTVKVDVIKTLLNTDKYRYDFIQNKNLKDKRILQIWTEYNLAGFRIENDDQGQALMVYNDRDFYLNLFEQGKGLIYENLPVNLINNLFLNDAFYDNKEQRHLDYGIGLNLQKIDFDQSHMIVPSKNVTATEDVFVLYVAYID